MFTSDVKLCLRQSCLTCLFLLHFTVARDDTIKITLSGGQLEGRLIVTDSGSEGWTFLGVPYAEAPVGRLRFAKPVSPKPWKGVLKCTEYKPACWQNVTGSGLTEANVISEDCLYANVFSGTSCIRKVYNGSNPFDSLCPVIFYVHGGGYEFDSPRMFRPEILVDNFASKNLVIVTFGYRLNVFGFWSTGNDDVVGNWALHDMIRGARWVQEEIHHFGGDASRVTIQGHSSSAMATSLLTMSPRTVGLFHQAIIMSGTSCKRFNALSDSVHDYGEVAVLLGCSTWSQWEDRLTFGKKILDCMRKINASTLGNAFRKMRGDATAAGTTARMTLPRIDGPNGLFPWPLSQLISKRRPLTTITGTVKDEVGLKKIQYLNATAETVTEMCRTIIEREKWNRKQELIGRCLEFYVSNNTRNHKINASGSKFPFWTERMAILLNNNGYFAPSHVEASSLVAKGSRVYLYSFDYEKQGLEDISPFHAFDMAYVNGLHIDSYNFNAKDRQVQWRYVSLFINFALYSNPTPRPIDGVTWHPLSSPWSFNYLSVMERLSYKDNYHESNIWFWNYELPHIDDQIVNSMGSKVLNSGLKETKLQQKHKSIVIAVVFSSLVFVAILLSISLILKNRRIILQRVDSERQALLR